ncbi:hypothetical protein SAMN02745704_01055 [Paucidesulfovibrio gracilis DSM 16080]|uniref:Uncharacterized protein n=1 Tax=Paucidesulfovibrio gracilis DSM 16080 TaxID=1121449 RepID=A0A1T4WL41_9BACT|nr:hypothetical protein [Paucidesulfovibrio gracilis]SKA77867.1 hypothetical protein SAMN02745704_01055 [Paucidesulfovibrio gracilis DSM 16080]
MIIYIILFILSLAAFFYVRSSITQDHHQRRQGYKEAHATLINQYEELLREQNEINSEIKTLTQQIIRSQHDAPPLRPGRVSKNAPNSEEALSAHMLTSGLITLEQHEKATHTMQTMKLDLLGTCLALGFIDEDTVLELKKMFPPEH